MSETSVSPESDGGLIRRGLAWKYAAEILNQLARIAFTFILARLLAPGEFGVAGMALVVSGFVLVFSDLSLGAAIVQRRTLSETHISTAFWVSVASGTAFTLAGIATAGAAAAAFDEPDVRDLFAAMSLAFLITSLGTTQAALLTRAMDFRSLELRNIIGTLAGGGVGVFVALAGGGAWAIVAQQLTFATVSTVLLWIASPWRPRFLFALDCLRDLAAYSAQVLGNSIAYIAQETTTTLLIGRLLGPAPLGLYTFANNAVLTPVRRVSLPLGQVLFPAFSRRQDDRGHIGSMWLKALSLSAAVMLPALAGLAVVAPEFVDVTLGEKWASLVPLIQILVWLGAMRALQGPTTAVVLAIGRPDLLLKFSCIGFVLAVASILLGVQWGIQGVAATLTVSAIAFGVVWIYFVGRIVRVSFVAYRLALSGIVQATIIMTVVVWAVRGILLRVGSPPGATLAACVMTGVLSYAVACRWRAPDSFAYFADLARRSARLTRHLSSAHDDPTNRIRPSDARYD